MSSLGSVVSGAADRLLARSQGRHDDYVLCATDAYWFRPAYTAGKCPLCGEEAPGGAPALPLLVRIDRFSLGMVVLAFVSLNVAAMVLFMYLTG